MCAMIFYKHVSSNKKTRDGIWCNVGPFTNWFLIKWRYKVTSCMLHILCKQCFLFHLYLFFHGDNVISFVLCNQTLATPNMHKAMISRPQMWLWHIMHLMPWLAFTSMGWFVFTLKDAHVDKLQLWGFQTRPCFFNLPCALLFWYTSLTTSWVLKGNFPIASITCKFSMVLLFTQLAKISERGLRLNEHPPRSPNLKNSYFTTLHFATNHKHPIISKQNKKVSSFKDCHLLTMLMSPQNTNHSKSWYV